jgi:hypothetical protein
MPDELLNPTLLLGHAKCKVILVGDTVLIGIDSAPAVFRRRGAVNGRPRRTRGHVTGNAKIASRRGDRFTKYVARYKTNSLSARHI